MLRQVLQSKSRLADLMRPFHERGMSSELKCTLTGSDNEVKEETMSAFVVEIVMGSLGHFNEWHSCKCAFLDSTCMVGQTSPPNALGHCKAFPGAFIVQYPGIWHHVSFKAIWPPPHLAHCCSGLG